MRIRKSTELSALLLGTAGYSGERPEPYVCNLNQSPWDVIALTSSHDGDDAAELTNLIDSSWFVPSLSTSSPPLVHQFNAEHSFNVNVDLRDSNVTAERLNSSMDNSPSLDVEGLNIIAAAANDFERLPDVEEPMNQSDNNSDKKSKPVDDVAVEMLPQPERVQPRRTAKKASKISDEFYYYSGFGPRWGRKRRRDDC